LAVLGFLFEINFSSIRDNKQADILIFLWALDMCGWEKETPIQEVRTI